MSINHVNEMSLIRKPYRKNQNTKEERKRKEKIRKKKLYDSNIKFYRLLASKRYYEQKYKNNEDVTKEKLILDKLNEINRALENELDCQTTITNHKPILDNTKESKLDNILEMISNNEL